MEEVIIKILMNGGPSGIIVGIGFLVIRSQINGLKTTIDELKDGKRWTETCETTHREVDRRLHRLETVANGALKR